MKLYTRNVRRRWQRERACASALNRENRAGREVYEWRLGRCFALCVMTAVMDCGHRKVGDVEGNEVTAAAAAGVVNGIELGKRSHS